ncbi:MAG: phage tail protein [Planctomycetota bacterium]|jgi:hypothetical protein|nr:phage tail protein [Planctomycetota bacterium]
MDAGIGNFGKVVFTVSAEQVKTFENFRRTSVAVFADHEVIFGKPASEFTGEELDAVSFTMFFNAELGVVPADEAETLREMKSSGEAHVLVIGGRSLGSFTIREVGEVVLHTLRGRTTVSSVDISLKEYAMQPTAAASAAMARDQAMRGTTGRGGPEKVPGAKSALQNRPLTTVR